MEEILERVKKGIQYRDMMLNIDETSEKRVTGYATTFNEPYTLYEDTDVVFREQVDKDAFSDADMSDVIMQYDHRGRVFARIRNNTLELRTDAKGLFVSANLGGTEIGRQLYEEIRGGYTDKMSFAFTVSGDRLERFEENNRRVYLRTIPQINKVFDVSARGYEILNLFYSVVILFMVFMCLENMRKTLTDKSDKYTLLRLPVKEQDLFLSKFSVLLIQNYLTAFLFVVPVNIIISLATSQSVLFWFMTFVVWLVLPIIVLLFSSIFIVPYIKLIDVIKNKYIVMFLLLTILLCGLFIFYSLFLLV
jgi:HK97 family phage prohead protease